MPKSKDNFTYRVLYSRDFQIVITTPKGWARENRHLFSKYSFIGENVPTVTQIGKKLAKSGFIKKHTIEQIIYYQFEK